MAGAQTNENGPRKTESGGKPPHSKLLSAAADILQGSRPAISQTISPVDVTGQTSHGEKHQGLGVAQAGSKSEPMGKGVRHQPHQELPKNVEADEPEESGGKPPHSIGEWRRGISETQLNRSVDIISPPPRLTPSQWAERFAYLPPEQNAEPGRFRLSRRPHQAAMLDDPVDPTVREIFWMGASQAMGKTVCLILLTEYVIHQVRKSIVMVRQTIDSCLDWKRDKLLPTINATPGMAGLLVDPRKRDSQSTSLNQRFPGGSLRLIGANSPSGFRSSSAPVVFQDEIDAFQENPEGDPCALADRSAITFSDAWLIKTSTTTLEGTSRIHAGYMLGDQQKYFVPCPLCGGFQHLKTEQMKFSFTAEEHARFIENDESRIENGELGIVKGKKPRSEIQHSKFNIQNSFKEIVNGNVWEIGAFAIQDTPRTIYVCEHCHRGWTDAQRIDAY